MNQVQNLRKMIDKAKREDKLNRSNLMNQLIILNSHSKFTNTLSVKRLSKQINKKRKFKHRNSDEDLNVQDHSQNVLNLTENKNEKA